MPAYKTAPFGFDVLQMGCEVFVPSSSARSETADGGHFIGRGNPDFGFLVVWYRA